MAQLTNIVVIQHDPQSAHVLAASLNRHFPSVRLAGSLAELKHAIPRYRAEAIVVDLEMVPLAEVQRLAHEFRVAVICTHRVPDEEMWAAALQAGAVDCCPNDDLPSILFAVNRMSRAHAA